MKKTRIKILLSTMLVFCLCLLSGKYVQAEETTKGSCGDNLTWAYQDGTLSITGSGSMYDYAAPEEAPWYSLVENISSLECKASNLTIGANAFSGLSVLQEITFTGSVPKPVSFLMNSGSASDSGSLTVNYPLHNTSWTSTQITSLRSNLLKNNSFKDITFTAVHDQKNLKAVPATCTETGLSDGSYCSTCGLVLKRQVVVSALGHSLSKTEALAATTKREGHTEYYTCDRCELLFSDETASTEITLADTVIPKLDEPDPVIKEDATVSASNISVSVGAKAAINASTDSDGDLTYRIASTSIATVSADGIITGKAPGKTTLTITASETETYNACSKKITVTVFPKKPTISSLTKSGTKATLKWKKITGITGYIVQYTTDSKFKKSVKSITLKASSTSTAVKSLKKGKTYYFRIRAYKTIGKTRYLSAWSTAKKIKIK